MCVSYDIAHTLLLLSPLRGNQNTDNFIIHYISGNMKNSGKNLESGEKSDPKLPPCQKVRFLWISLGFYRTETTIASSRAKPGICESLIKILPYNRSTLQVHSVINLVTQWVPSNWTFFLRSLVNFPSASQLFYETNPTLEHALNSAWNPSGVQWCLFSHYKLGNRVTQIQSHLIRPFHTRKYGRYPLNKKGLNLKQHAPHFRCCLGWPQKFKVWKTYFLKSGF